jgi:hypothetical protein
MRAAMIARLEVRDCFRFIETLFKVTVRPPALNAAASASWSVDESVINWTSNAVEGE